MRAALYLATGVPTVSASGVSEVVNGFKNVGTATDGRVVLHAEPGQDPLPSMEVVKAPGWVWADLRRGRPRLADRVLDDRWERVVDGRTVRVRRPTRPTSGTGAGWTRVASDLPPHYWAGDED